MKKKKLVWQQKMFITTIILMFVIFMFWMTTENLKEYWEVLEIASPAINIVVVVSEIILAVILIISVGLIKYNGYEFTADVSIKDAPQEFNDAFEQILNKHSKNLDDLKGDLPIIEVLTWIFLVLFPFSFGIGSLIMNIPGNNIYIEIFGLVIIILLLCTPTILITLQRNKKKKYVQYFKENCMKDFFEILNINYSTLVSDEIANNVMAIYNEAKCNTRPAYTVSIDDIILKNIENKEISFCDAKISADFKSNDGSLFAGLFSYIRLENNINSRVKIATNEVYEYDTIKRVNLDSTEFEKIFDVYSEDSILAVRILTADIMELMVEFYDKHCIAFELNITNDLLAIKFYTGKLFEPKLVGNALDINVFYAYYVILEFAEEVVKRFNKVLNEFEV